MPLILSIEKWRTPPLAEVEKNSTMKETAKIEKKVKKSRKVMEEEKRTLGKKENTISQRC